MATPSGKRADGTGHAVAGSARATPDRPDAAAEAGAPTDHYADSALDGRASGAVAQDTAAQDTAARDAAAQDAAAQDTAIQDAGSQDSTAFDEPPDYGDDIPAWEDGPLADASGYAEIDDAAFDPDDVPPEPVMGGSGPMFAEPAPRADLPRLANMTAGAWPELAAKLPLTGLAAELARQSEWLGSQGERVRLRVAVRSLAESPGKSRLRTVLSEHFGTVVELDVEYGRTGEDTAHAVEQARRAARQKEAEQAVQADPLVRELIDDFGATVVAGSIRAEASEPKAA